MMQHDLKTWPVEYEAIRLGHKRHEYRYDDRGFGVGDILNLQEWDPAQEQYTGRWMHVRVTWINAAHFGIPVGYCVMSFEVL